MTLLFAAHDPGGANALLPAIEEATRRGLSYALCPDGPGAACWMGVDAEVIERRNVSTTSFDALITGTSLHSDFERDLWHSTDAPSAAVIDAWTTFRARFEHGTDNAIVQPDRICVIDEFCRGELLAEDWCTSEVIVVGQSHIARRAARIAARRADDRSSAAPRIVFVSEPVTEDESRTGARGYNPQAIFDALVASLPTGHRFDITVRTHPREDLSAWAQTAVKIDSDGDIEELLVGADHVAGMASMALLEAVEAGIPTLSLEPGRIKSSNPGVDAHPGIFRAHRLDDVAPAVRDWLAAAALSAEPNLNGDTQSILEVALDLARLSGEVRCHA